MTIKHCLLLGALVSATLAAGRDAKHYPYDTVAYAAEISQLYSGRYGELFPISLQVGLDPSFNTEQRHLVDRALRIFVERALQKHVVDCAYRNGFKDMPATRTLFQSKLYEALRPLALSADVIVPSFAFIASYRQDDRSVGVGYVDLFNEYDKPFPPFDTRHYLYIALNRDHMGSQAAYHYAVDAEYWAGVIGHEFLHNLGLTHPSGYAGSFIKEYGKCVQSNGGDFSLMEDFEDHQVFPDLDD